MAHARKSYDTSEHRDILSIVKSAATQHKSPPFTNTITTICRLRSDLYMKATGIVRRIDSSVIIGAKVRSLENTGFSLIFVQFHQYPKP